MRIKLTLFIVAFCTVTLSFSQSQLELANKYLESRGELVFSFTANNFEEANELARILSFDHGQDSRNPLKIRAYGNKKSFEKFLNYNLRFEVDIEANEPKNVVMFDPKIHKKGVSGKTNYTALTFPLTSYPTYTDYVAQMNEFVAVHPTIARLENIGTTPGSAAGTHDLLFIVLSDNVASDEAEPRLMYTSSMHGNEIAGYPSMLNLIDHLIEAYNDSGNSDYGKAQALINGAEIWINPLANPDGTYRTTNSNVNSAIRGNANAIDLNRNYPAPDGTLHPDGESYQYETTQFMNLADTYHFVLAANFHGGEEVFNYPWDFTYDRTVDDDWWRLVGEEYALNAQTDSPAGYSDPNDPGPDDSGEYFDFLKATIYEPNPILGVSHGADWYLIDGGRQDYMNFEHQCREVTIELSQTKISPSPASAINYDILDMWDYNKNAYIDFLLQGTYGFRGIVKDVSTSLPVKAKITVVGRDDQPLSRNSWVETDIDDGDFYRLIEAGTYNILIEADCYTPVTLSNKVAVDGFPTDLGTILVAPTTDIPDSLSESNITSTSATLNWGDMGVSSYDVRYRINGSSDTWSEINVTPNTLAISGLAANTTYEYQISSVCNTNSEFSNLVTFSTLAASYCNTAIGDTSDRGITNVLLIGETTINNSDSDNTNSGYEDFTAMSADVEKGKQYSLSVTASSGTNGNDPLYTRVFIDFNGDSDFDDLGESIDLGTIVKATESLTTLSPKVITIPTTPENTHTGLIRMRISSKKGGYPTSCEDFSDSKGEVEDYTLNMIDASLGIQDELLSKFEVYPNPVKEGQLYIGLPQDIIDFKVTVSSLLGKKIYTEDVKLFNSKKHSINLNKLASGVYLLTISTELGRASKKIIVE